MKRAAVLGGGLSGLAAAFWLKKEVPDLSVTIFEKEKDCGGKIRTLAREGFRVEWGPAGFLDSKDPTLELARAAGFEKDLIRAHDRVKQRFICIHGRLCPVPAGPLAFLKSPILSPLGRLRVLREPWIAPSDPGSDETVFAFGQRRLGTEFSERFLDPMATGIFAGNIQKLSLRACFPRIFELEQNYGSLIRALIKLMKAKKTDVSAPSQGPGRGKLVSMPGGAQAIARKLEAAMAGKIDVRKSCDILSVRKNSPYSVVYKADGKKTAEAFDVIVCALPAYALSDVLSAICPAAAERAAWVPYSPMAVVGLGYPKDALGNGVNGFGFLVPEIEKRKILGAVFSSLVFPDRAPAGHDLITVMTGGAKHPEIASMPEDGLIAMAADELARMLKIRERPVFSACFKHEKAIPHYETGFLANLRALEEILARDLPGVFLCGNAFYGVGMNDCTKRARETARAAGIFLSKTG